MENEQWFFLGVRVKLNQAVAKSPYPDWLCGYQQFDPARLALSDRHALTVSYYSAAEVGDIATVVGVHTWPERVDYLIEYPDRARSLIPAEAAEFYDLGNIVVAPLPAQF